MSSTSTNKQPLLIDRVFYNSINSDTLVSGADSIQLGGTNTSAVILDCTLNDGGIIEDMLLISRATDRYWVDFYFSSAIDFLRPQQAVYAGSIQSGPNIGDFVHVDRLPYILAPVPQVQPAGTLATGLNAEAQTVNEQARGRNQAQYCPSGRALWATVRGTISRGTGSPVIAVQGGFY